MRMLCHFWIWLLVPLALVLGPVLPTSWLAGAMCGLGLWFGKKLTD